MDRKRSRTFTGCSRCRARKIKCDEARPSCVACCRLGKPCPGYDAKFIWVLAENGKSVIEAGHDSRRVLPCENTWNGYETLPSDVVDFIICQLDEAEDNVQLHLWPLATHNPFGLFPAIPTILPPLNTEFCPDAEDMFASDITPYSPLSSPSPASTSLSASTPIFTLGAASVPRTMEWLVDSTYLERFLFHHYVSHVAAIMLPYEHPRNVWKSHYPAAALNHGSPYQKALRNAILAHAAFNVAHLRGGDLQMLATATGLYGTAMHHLLPHIACGDKRENFSDMIAAVISLMFVEVYSGESHKWRRHFEGAWKLFEQHRSAEPWKYADDSACVSLQSLIIVKIIGGTSSRKPVETKKPAAMLDNGEGDTEGSQSAKVLAPILSSSEFGFTIGAPRVVLQCIASITDYRERREQGKVDIDDRDDLLKRILSLLNVCKLDLVATLPESPQDIRLSVERAQSQAFLHATYIYLYRTLLDVTPSAVCHYVSQAFFHVASFFALSREMPRNFSIWPAFIAAAEAYTEQDLQASREWLASTMFFGLGSRNGLQRVLEEIWRRREAIATLSGGAVDRGQIAVDWRQVMHELDCDVLIV